MKHFFTILSLMFLLLSAKAQIKTASFEGGRTIDYEILNSDPDSKSKLNLLISGGVGFDYFKPDFGYFKATIGIFNMNFEGIYYLGSKTKDIEKKIELDGNSTGNNSIISYVVRENITKKTYNGIHAGYKLYTNSTFSNGYTFSEIALGYGINRTKLLTYTTYAKKKPHTHTHTTSFNVYTDMLLFANVKKDSEPVTENTPKIGFRLYMDGKFGFGKKRDSWGITYALGGAYGPGGLNPIMSLGLCFSLMH